MTLWNRDCTDYPDLNLYGSHPFLMEIRPGQHPMWSVLYARHAEVKQQRCHCHFLTACEGVTSMKAP